MIGRAGMLERILPPYRRDPVRVLEAGVNRRDCGLVLGVGLVTVRDEHRIRRQFGVTPG